MVKEELSLTHKLAWKIANQIFETWNRDYQYPMTWEVRVEHLKRLIVEALLIE
jgi:hypothetical protein